MEFLNRRISIRNFRVQASIGFHAAEQLRTQTVLIDIDLHLPALRGEMPDEVSATVDYDRVYAAIPPLLASRHFKLQESLCHALLKFCVALPGVCGARVRIRKPEAYADCESAGYSAELHQAPACSGATGSGSH
ncbi:dihydroneopterin aldolase [Uliginosibacterium sp. 31-12]|uniref:dihydroneopterin aldolase n=1 Tax=Uliginosibacterium sp. 31-12 TaxID=3062781 RepID=UPI0026E207B8|nr:dihydroneopterin aldolase [Uliginosibacterium sp. 31-12]MDO6388078.1 dihydroneopterin aldolase [Uliginosibacterium sp. 31-12]